MDEAAILHADLDAFYASVEQRDDPALRGRPVIVGGGVVLAASYEAKARGVRTAMGGRQARQLCPDAIVVSPRFTAYSEASKHVYAVFEDLAPVVEGLSIDEAFLDVRGMRRIAGEPFDIGRRLRQIVAERVGLAITVGIARTKFLAKVASGVAKPDGLLLVPPDGELEFLHPLEIERLWGVGQVTSQKLRAVGITTVGQVARMDVDTLIEIAGRAMGHQLHALSHNRDPRRVRPRVRRRSMGAQSALGRTPRTNAQIDATLLALVDRVTGRMRAAHRVGRTVTLRLRFGDFSRATRSRTLPFATNESSVIAAAARRIYVAALPMITERGVTLVGITVSNLAHDTPSQLLLPLDDRGNRAALEAAVDGVRDRFGRGAITRAVHLGRDAEESVPLLPD